MRAPPSHPRGQATYNKVISIGAVYKIQDLVSRLTVIRLWEQTRSVAWLISTVERHHVIRHVRCNRHDRS